MMNALRLNGGFDPALFESRTTLPLISIESELRQAEKEGLIERSALRIAPTTKGQRFLNELLRRFLPG
jgi:oxygen-independent coproporphyrinogen-3 oxidase